MQTLECAALLYFQADCRSNNVYCSNRDRQDRSQQAMVEDPGEGKGTGRQADSGSGRVQLSRGGAKVQDGRQAQPERSDRPVQGQDMQRPRTRRTMKERLGNDGH